MQKETIDALTSPVAVYTRSGPGNVQYKYVKGEDVIARLNTAFKHEWSSTVEQVFEKGNQILVWLSVKAGDTVHQGFGGADIAVYRDGARKGQPINISNNYKAAFTSALKKAAEQFGVGLAAEDTVELGEGACQPASAPEVPANPAPQAAPVSGTAVINSAKPTTVEQQVMAMAGNVNMDAIRQEINKLVASNNAASTPSKAPTQAVPAAPKKEETLAKSFKDNTKDSVPPSSTGNGNPFTPSGGGEEKINDIQLNALGGLAKMKKALPEEAIASAVKGSPKKSFDQLTRNEAKDVIQFLNSTNV